MKGIVTSFELFLKPFSLMLTAEKYILVNNTILKNSYQRRPF